MVWLPETIRSFVPPRFPLLLLLLFPVLAGSLPARSQAPVEITIQGQSGYPLSFQGLQGSLGASASRALETDLRNAGHFRFAPAPAGAFAVSGVAQPGGVDGRLHAPNGALMFSRTYRTGTLTRDLRRFADDVVLAITGKPGIASSQVVFVATKTGNKELYLCDYDGGNVRQLTRDGSISVSPSLSPDARSIVYTSYRSGYPDIFLINLESGARSRIIKSPGTNSGAAFSPDGDRLALTMSFSGNPELYVTSTRGGGARRLTRSRAVEASPAWFPDGRKLVFVSNESGGPQLYEMASNGGPPRHLGTGFGYCTDPNVAPDGQRLAFSARTSGGMAVAVHDFRSRKTSIITSGGGENPCWGPDSRHLVYTRSGDLYLHDVENGTAKRIVSGMGAVSEPGWSR